MRRDQHERLRVVVQVRQQRLEILNRGAQLDWDGHNRRLSIPDGHG
jgi:hypothetical protein